MSTTLEKTIGPTGDYATLTAWFADCPANLTTADATGYIYRGKVQNTELVSATTLLNITGIAGTDATHYIELTADTGASFSDHASKTTNPLRYNPSVGAALKCTAGHPTRGVTCDVAYTRINRLQIINSEAGGHAGATVYIFGSNIRVDGCIIEGAATVDGAVVMAGYGAKLTNSTAISRRIGYPTGVVYLESGGSAINVTAVAASSVLDVAFTAQYSSNIIKNCYAGNCTAAHSGAGVTISNSHTSVSGPPSGWSATTPYSTATFASITDASLDLRLVSGSALIDAAATDADAALDIIGTARPSGAAYDVGAWEYVGAGGGVTATGAVTGPGAAVTGSATIYVVYSSSGSIQGSSAIVSGSASWSAPAGTITIPAVVDWSTGALKTGQTGVQVDVLNISTGALVVRKTGQTTHGTTADLVVSDALIIAATTYAVIDRYADGSIGIGNYTAT